MAELGKLIVKIGADVEELKKGLQQSTKHVDGFRDSLSSAGKMAAALGITAVVAGLATLGHTLQNVTAHAGKHAEEMEQLAMRTGIAAVSLEGMSVALARSGLTHQDMAKGMQQLSRNLIEAQSGTGEAAEAFERLGISIQGMTDTETLLKTIADRFQELPDGANKTAFAMTVFGRAGAQMIPLLNAGAAGLEEAKKKAEEFGLVLKDTERSALSKYDDTLDEMAQASEGLKTQLAIGLAPAMTVLSTKTTESITLLTQMIRAMRDGGVEADKFALKLGKFLTTEAGAAALDQGVGKGPTTGLLKVPPLPEDMDLPDRKRFITMEERQVELGHQIVRQAQTRALLVQQEQKFLPSILAMQADIEKGRARSDAEANAGFGNDLMAQMEAMRRAEGMDVAMKPTFDFSDGLGMDAAAQIKEVAKGWRIVTPAVQDYQNEQATVMEQLQQHRDLTEGVFAIEAAHWATSNDLVRDSTNVRQLRIDLIKDERDIEIASAEARGESELKLQLIRDRARAKMIMAAKEFPTFWDQQLQQINQGFAFAWGQITNQVSGALAQQLVMGNDWVQTMKSLATSVLQAFINMGIQMVVNWLQAQSAMTATQAAADATRTASTTAAAVTSTAAVTASVGAQTATIAAFGASAMSMLMGVWTLAKAVLQSIAAAMKATVFGIPVGLAITAALVAGAVMVSQANKTAGALMGAAAVGTAALTFFADGGIATGPTAGVFGEAGPEAVIPLTGSRGRKALGQMGGDSGERIIHVHVHTDGRETAHAVARWLPGELRTMGIPI